VTAQLVLLGISLAAQPPAADPAHARNPVYQSLRKSGWQVGSTAVPFPKPSIAGERLSDDEERDALRSIAGSEQAAAEFTRDSVSAPVVIRNRDLKAPDGLIRLADLWFVVRADLDGIDPDRHPLGEDGKPVEAGNMRFTAGRLPEKIQDDRKGGELSPSGTVKEWYVHRTGRLLDRIHAETTDRVTATRGEDSWVFASRTEPRFDGDRAFPNRWFPIEQKGSRDVEGKAEPYAGGACYLKISRLGTVPGALLVEAHFAFSEPRAWFGGASVLRSKFAPVAQDRVRRLRRDLRKSKPPEEKPAHPTSRAPRG
jgi:hypothetical protein